VGFFSLFFVATKIEVVNSFLGGFEFLKVFILFIYARARETMFAREEMLAKLVVMRAAGVFWRRENPSFSKSNCAFSSVNCAFSSVNCAFSSVLCTGLNVFNIYIF